MRVAVGDIHIVPPTLGWISSRADVPSIAKQFKPRETVSVQGRPSSCAERCSLVILVFSGNRHQDHLSVGVTLTFTARGAECVCIGFSALGITAAWMRAEMLLQALRAFPRLINGNSIAGNETRETATGKGCTGLSLPLTETKPDIGVPAGTMNRPKHLCPKGSLQPRFIDLGLFEPYSGQRVFQPQLSVTGRALA